MGIAMSNEWVRVSFAADCDGDDDCGLCGVCGDEYAECECPGPTMDGYEYKFDENNVMWARRIENDTPAN